MLGFTLPRTADAQYRATQQYRVLNPSPSNLQRNDLLFFGGWPSGDNPAGYAGIQHVAISLGGNSLIQEGPLNVNIATVSGYGRYFLYATRPFPGDAMNFSGLNPLIHVKVAKGGAQYKDDTCAHAYPEGNPGYADVGLYAYGKRADGVLLAAIKRPDGAVGYLGAQFVTPIETPQTLTITGTVGDPNATITWK